MNIIMSSSFISILILLIFIICHQIFGVYIISSPTIKGLRDVGGNWGPWDRCPEGEYAASIQLKIQSYKGNTTTTNQDDTALNTIKFKCAKPESYDYTKVITSKNGSEGEWGSELPCEGFLIGFQVQVEPYESSKDCVGVINLRVFCTGSQGTIEGEGYESKETVVWTREQKCLKNQAICGLQTQADEQKGDQCGLTHLKMECCEIKKEKICENPTDDWVLLVECDNLEGLTPIKCKFTKKRGTTTSKRDNTNGKTEIGLNGNIELSGSMSYIAVSAAFKTKLGTSTTTGHKWEKESSSTFSEETTHEVEFEVPQKMKTQLKQIVGSCGHITVYTGIFKKVDTLVDPILPKEKTLNGSVFP